MSILKIPTAKIFEPLLKPARYKGVFGGRGSGKSHFFGELLVETCEAEPGTLAVCIRESQKTLAQSSKRLIESKIENLRLSHRFRIYSDRIATPGDGLIIFRGLAEHSAETIKSLEGFRIAWIDEAQTLSARSLALLRPTIRASASELWASWNPYNIPLGAGIDFWGSTAPNSSFAFPYGQAISRTTYAALFALVGTAHGSGDGSTTFNLPDKRGRISVALDTMGGAASGRVTSASGGIDGTTIGATGGGQTYTMQRSDLPNVSPTFTGSAGTVSVTGNQGNILAANPIVGGVPAGGSGIADAFQNGSQLTPTASGSFTPVGIVQSLNGGVTQTAMRTMPPAIVAPYLIRVI
jgi:microcystin-dependent protein